MFFGWIISRLLWEPHTKSACTKNECHLTLHHVVQNLTTVFWLPSKHCKYCNLPASDMLTTCNVLITLQLFNFSTFYPFSPSRQVNILHGAHFALSDLRKDSRFCLHIINRLVFMTLVQSAYSRLCPVFKRLDKCSCLSRPNTRYGW
jgi:hypothetical protein